MDAQFTDICKRVVKHFDGNHLFASDTKYFISTQIQRILCQAALQKTSIEDIAEQKRTEDKTSPTAETVRNAMMNHFANFSPHEFGKYISSLLQATVMSSPQYQKLRRCPLDFVFDETTLSLQERIFIFKWKANREPQRKAKRLRFIIARSRK